MRTVAELIEADELAGAATADDVAHAQQEARQAAAQAATLQKRIVDGDDSIEPAEITKARELAEFAQLRAQAAAGKHERTKRAARLRACDQLRVEIEQHADDAGSRFAALLRKVEQAVDEFAAAVEARNTQVQAWYRRMRELGVPDHTNPLPLPPPQHGHLGICSAPTGSGTGPTLAAGRRRVPTGVPAHRYVTNLIEALQANDRTARLAKLYDQLTTVDRVAGDVDPGLRFFRSVVGGGVIHVHASKIAETPPSGGKNHYQRQIDDGDLVEISREEAWGA